MKSLFRKNITTAVLTTVFASISPAEIVGTLAEVANSTAWLSFDEKSDAFKGIVDRQKEVDSDGIDRRTPSRILKSFLSTDGSIRKDLIDQTIQRIRSRMRADFSYDCREEKACTETSETEFKKWSEKGAGLASNVAISRLERFASSGLKLPPSASDVELNSKKIKAVAQDLFEALEIAEAIRSDDRWLGRGPIRNAYDLKNPIRIRIPSQSNSVVEASNLLTKEGTLAGPKPPKPAELDPSDSGFWRKPKRPVSEFQMLAYSGQTATFVGKEVIDPLQPIDVTFATAKGGGATPKIRVDYKNGKTKLKFKLKYHVDVAPPRKQNTFGNLYASLLKSRSEVRAETAVNNIAAALGFTVEPTYFKHSVRMFLTDDGFSATESAETNLRSFRSAQQRLFKSLSSKSLAQTFGAALVDRESAFHDVRQVAEGDQKGRYYLNLKRVLLEAREDGKTEIDLGFFVKHTFGREFKREFRAFQLYYAWISDTDTGDRNSDLKLVQVGQDWKLAYSASDMGASLGFLGAKDTPNLFLNSMVRKVEKNAIILNYLTEARNPISDALTLADAHWFLSYATQITPKQFQTAFLGAGYNACVAEVLANKMMSRRQSLVIATGFPFAEPRYFDLSVCQKQGYEIGKNWEILRTPTPPVDLKEIHPTDHRYLNFPEDSIGWTRGRPLDVALGAASVGAELATGAIGQVLQRVHVVPGLFVDGGRVQTQGGIGLVSILPARYIVANPLPNPTSPWLVVDIYRTGFGPQFWNQQPLGLIRNERLRFIAEGYVVRERIMVRPVEQGFRHLGFQQLSEIYKRPDRYISVPFSKIDSEDISTLKTGEILITSTYKGFSGGPLLSPGFFGIGSGLASVGVGIDRIQRQAVYRESASDFLAAWIKSDLERAKVGVGVMGLLGFGNILGIGGEKEKEHSRLFRFKNSPQEIEALESELKKKTPELPQDKEVFESRVGSSTKSILLSAFGLTSIRKSSERKLIETSVGNQNLKQLDLQRSRWKGGLFRGAFENSSVTTRGTLGKADELLLRMDVVYRNISATKDDIPEFRKLVEIFPENGLIRHEQEWNTWLGSVAVDGTILLSETALKKFLTLQTQDQLCGMIVKELKRDAGAVIEASTLGKLTPSQLCSFAVGLKAGNPAEAAKLLAPGSMDQAALAKVVMAARQFLWRMPMAQAKLNEFFSLRGAPGPVDAKKLIRAASAALDQVVELFQENALPQVVMRVLDQLIDPQDHYRFVSVRSSTEGIPGQNAIVADAKGDEGFFDRMNQQDLSLTIDSAIHRVLSVVNEFDGMRNIRLDRAYDDTDGGMRAK